MLQERIKRQAAAHPGFTKVEDAEMLELFKMFSIELPSGRDLYELRKCGDLNADADETLYRKRKLTKEERIAVYAEFYADPENIENEASPFEEHEIHVDEFMFQ